MVTSMMLTMMVNLMAVMMTTKSNIISLVRQEELLRWTSMATRFITIFLLMTRVIAEMNLKELESFPSMIREISMIPETITVKEELILDLKLISILSIMTGTVLHQTMGFLEEILIDQQDPQDLIIMIFGVTMASHQLSPLDS